MKRERKSMICAGVVSGIDATERSAFAGIPGVNMLATVRFGDGWIDQRFRVLFGASSTIFVLGEPVFVEYRKVGGEWRFFDVRRTLRRENGTASSGVKDGAS